MPWGKHRTLLNIQNFIRKKKHLRQKLLRDLENLRIVKEADVECAAYYHLRRYIGEDPKWRVFARMHVPKIGHYVDLLIFKNYRPAIALELKWNQENIGKKDRKALDKAVMKLKVQKAFWLSLVWRDKKKERFDKKLVEKNVLFRVVGRLGLKGKKQKDYKADRARFRSKMVVGKGQKP